MLKRIMQMMLVLAALVSLASAALADPPKLPEPQPKYIEVLQDGKIVVYMADPRNAGYAIGDTIPVVLVFELKPDPNANEPVPPVDPTGFLADVPTAPAAPVARPLPVPQIDISSLRMHIISGKPSQVQVVGEPETQMFRCGDKQCLRVVFFVTQFATMQKNPDGSLKTQVAFSVDFLYAVVTQPDGQPDWKTASTPEAQVGIVPTASPSQTIPPEGDLTLKDSRHSPLVPYLFGAGIPLMLVLFGELAWLVYGLYIRPRPLSPDEMFWQEVDAVIQAAGESDAWQLEDYQKIIYEFRRRFGVSTLHASDALKKLAAHPQIDAITFIFSLEDTFFKKDGVVSEKQRLELLQALRLLIPRQ